MGFNSGFKGLNATTTLNCLHEVVSGLQANGKCKTRDGTDDMVIGHTK